MSTSVSNNAKIRLSEIVKEYLDERMQGDLSNFDVFMRVGKNGYRDLWHDGFAITVVDQLTLDPNLPVADIPDDCLKIMDIYAEYRGKLYPLTQDKRIFFKKDDCGDDVLDNRGGGFGGTSYGNTRSNHFFRGQDIGANYGAGSRSYFASYNINQEEDRIEFDSAIRPQTLIIKYMSTVDSQEKNGDFLVHPFLADAIKDYIDWKTQQRKRGVSRGEKNQLELQYEYSKHKAKKMKGSMSFEQIKDVVRSTYGLAPKQF